MWKKDWDSQRFCISCTVFVLFEMKHYIMYLPLDIFFYMFIFYHDEHPLLSTVRVAAGHYWRIVELPRREYVYVWCFYFDRSIQGGRRERDIPTHVVPALRHSIFHIWPWYCIVLSREVRTWPRSLDLEWLISFVLVFLNTKSALMDCFISRSKKAESPLCHAARLYLLTCSIDVGNSAALLNSL